MPKKLVYCGKCEGQVFEISDKGVRCKGCGKHYAFPVQTPRVGERLPAVGIADWVESKTTAATKSKANVDAHKDAMKLAQTNRKASDKRAAKALKSKAGKKK